MPPVNDNIGDALSLTQDGAEHTLALTIVDASLEAGEDAFTDFGPGTCWAKIDLSALPAGIEVTVDFAVDGSGGGFEPYMEALRVLDDTFDPNAPDFTKLDYTSGAYIGDGTETPPPSSFTLIGGPVPGATGESSESGVYYVYLTDWNWAVEGSVDLTYTVEAPICFDAEDVINPDSPTASVVVGRVRETYDEWWDAEYVPENQRDAALKFTWSGNSGLYTVLALGRISDPGGGAVLGSSLVRIVVAVNGVPIIPAGASNSWGAFDTDEQWYCYPGLSGGSYDSSDYQKAPWVPLSAGDVVEVFIASNAQTSTFTFLPFDLEAICFTLDPDAPASAFCTGVFGFPDEPLGDAWGSPNGWGGQQHVPDEIWTLSGITPYDEGNFPWGINYSDSDFVALPDGTLYWFVHDAIDAGIPTTPDPQNHYAVVKKYDPGTDTWSQIATLNIRDPTDRYPTEAVSCQYDGAYVYFVWWELETFDAGTTPDTYEWLWHCKRLDPSDDSIIELGTGQSAFSVAPWPNYPGGILACGIACAGDGGDVYVSAIEQTGSPDFDWRVIVWRWNGTTWTDLALPDPTVTSSGWEVVGENGFYDVLSPMVCARQGEGPVADGVTVVYCYSWFDSVDGIQRYALVTIPYTVGSGWGSEIRSGGGTIEAGRANNVSAGTTAGFNLTWLDMDVMWSAALERLVLAVDFGGTGEEIWDVLQMNDAGTQWEILEPVAPASSSGPWRQSRNTAAIGPDGNVFAARFTATIPIVTWEPKLIKNSSGYLTGWAVAAAPAMGERPGLDPTWYPYIQNTSHYRIRIVGNEAYVLAALYVEDYDHDTGTWQGDYGDGFWIFKLDYVPCRTFRPYVYRRPVS